MEVLQCDGCHFRADSYDDLKAHIQDVHTAFLQPTAVGDRSPEHSGSNSLNSLHQTEEDEQAELHSLDLDPEPLTGSSQTTHKRSVNQPSRSTTQFFQCKFCVRYFRSKSLLNDHTKRVHAVVSAASEGSSSPPQTSKQTSYSILMHEGMRKVFSCQYCTYKSPRRARILKHQKMFHKYILLDSPDNELATNSVMLPTQEASLELPEAVVQRSILESMVKPLTKSRGNFSCEWCGYQTLRRERWCDHMMKKHRNMVKIMSSIQQQDGDTSIDSPKPSSLHSPSSSPNSGLPSSSLNGKDVSPGNTGFMGSSESAARSTPAQVDGFSSCEYSQKKSKIPNSTGTSTLSERPTFVMSDVSNSAGDFEKSSVQGDSRSSSDDEAEDMDDTLAHLSDDSKKQLLSDEEYKILETKGIPFKKHMNRFQCPFCSFLTMHRQSISRHIEKIHLSGKKTLYKCDKCPFICTNPLRLGTHKQCHVETSSEWENMDDSLYIQDEEPMNGGNVSSKVSSKKSCGIAEIDPEKSYHCSLCSYSTTTLKGLRVHQQHKHSYCDNMKADPLDGSPNEQLHSEHEIYSSSSYVKKTQTSILGFSSKKLVVNKSARKSINDSPLDLSPVKKRTRIDEIANNLQSKISQSSQRDEAIINLEEMDEEEEENGENETDEDKVDVEVAQLSKKHCISRPRRKYSRKMKGTQEEGKRKLFLHEKLKSSSTLIQLTISDDDDNENECASSAGSKSLQDQAEKDSGGEVFRHGSDYSDDTATLFYCKHCEYQNKSARSVSTHYQRMHPYIKFNFRYILDPEDQSAVFRCLECFVEYTTFDDLNQHYIEHHPEAMNVLNFNQPDLVYKCRFCLYTSPNVRSLMPHYQRMHPTVKINNAMIFSSYVVEPRHKDSIESQTLREILNSGPKNFCNSSSGSKSSVQFSPVHKSFKSQEYYTETEVMKESVVNNVVVYDCDVCSFASPNMHSVLVHYQKKHPEQKASYFRIQKTMRIVSVDRAQASNNDSPDASSSDSLKTSNVIPMGVDEDIYYCKHCVYSNRSVVGVLVHYQKRHPEIKVTAKYIKHAPPTSGLMKLMEELQIAPPKQFLKSISNNGVDNSSRTKSGGDKGELEMLYFCQHCDYGNQTVKGVLIHYQKKHRDVKANADLVRRHTAVVRSQRERAQSNNSSVPAAISDSEATRPLRALKCRHCTYTSPYIYALKKHLKKDHPTVKATATTILHWAYQDGILEAGYHCEWCIYFHPEPNGLLMHYQKRHPEHNVDYTYMATKLWAGPDTSASQSVGNADSSKHYQCKDCAFQACSIWDITNHYQAVHPWAVKGDDSVLLDIIKGNLSSEKRQTSTKEDLSIISGQFNSHACEQGQEQSLDLAGQLTKIVSHQSFPSTSISNNPYQCTVCFSEYNSLHGLLTHYGKKHPGMKVKAADFAQETDINPSSVYKCRHCPYVNSRIHGVLTHYQKRHPQIKVTAEDFADDIEEVADANEGEEKYKSQRQGFGAYRCKMCPYTHGTLEKLKIHYEKYHNQPASDMFRPTFADLSSNMDETHVESSLADVEDATDFHAAFSEFSVDKGEKQSFRCQLCKYFCSTRKGIARHYRIKHNNVRAQPEGKNNVFKCALCSYTNPIRKGLAAHYQKRHHIDAYYTHCLAASKTATEKPSKVVVPAAEEQGPMLSEELRVAVEKRKCSLCSFQAFSRKSIVSHYIKRHPGVFPKKQHSSKLGRYFTIVYDKEPENPAEVEAKRATEEPCVTEQEDDSERLPFKCSRCFKLSFNTAELLCMHYTEHHSKDLKRDFATLAGPTGNGTDNYQCARCDLKFLSLPELGTHLASHNEDIRKQVERQERRKQLLNKQKGAEQLDGTPEKLENHASNVPIGYRCNFCVEVHPTLRAICNHLRKHVQYGETKAGRVKHEVPEIPVSAPGDGDPNGDLEEAEPVTLGLSPVSPEAAAAVATDAKPGMAEPEQRLGKLVAVSERRVEKRACGQCDRVFMSMQGLRSHERSHTAMAAALSRREDKYICQYCPFSSPFRHNLQRHILSHHRHRKPFLSKSAYLSRFKSHLNKAHPGENTYRCLSCPQSFMTISQLKEHSQEIHGEVLTLPRLRAATQSTVRPQRPARMGEKLPVTIDSTDATYTDPADVQQQQRSHYQQVVQSATPSPAPTPADAVLTCEFCEFSSGYMQSLRRHYRDRHGGKKLYKCKDCSYFTCYKSAFTMHVESGHSALPVEGPRDLHCPLCLYHTKVKSSMIDHVVLHREERVVPLEVSRSKLSRHLQGVVFSCHKCTFTCSGDESLKQHLNKHGELKPYKCQLCFYDSGELEELEAHLRDEHKVICNFELVGRVNLDQLEAMMGKLSSTEEDEEDREEEEEEERDGELKEAEKAEAKDAPGSPGSEKRFACKFCGRAFTNSAEWERHVLRHGMTVANSRMKDGLSSVAEASSQTGLVSLTAKLERPDPSDGMEVESGSLEQEKACTENVENEGTTETKNSP